MTSPSRSYDIEQVLGRGGFGTVYRARLSGSGGFTKHVALKVLNAEFAGTTDVLQRLRDEARMLGLLRHRAIVQVEGLVHLDDRWAVVMEYVDGASLSELVRLGPIPPSVTLEVGEEVAAALDVAYARPASTGEVLRLLHRDIKPSNVQVTARGEVKLLDFGVARADFGSREAHTRSLILGSIDYLAPERLEMLDTHAGDIYALGATLYELLAGAPFGRASINPRRHAAQLDERLGALAATVRDPELIELLRSTLGYDEESRPDAATLARRLRDLRRNHTEPWLRDWAEAAVPAAQAVRAGQTADEDVWSGSTLRETGSAGASDTMAIDVSSGTAEPRRTEPAPARPEVAPPPAPRPPRAEAPKPVPNVAKPAVHAPRPARAPGRQAGRAPRPAPPRRRSPLRTCLGVTLIGGALGLIGLILGVVLVPTALVALLSGTGLWASAWEDTVRDSFATLEQKALALPPSAERDRIVTLARTGQDPRVAPAVGFWELVFFDIAASEAIDDGALIAGESDDLEKRFRAITR
jgi:hypothetical protein